MKRKLDPNLTNIAEATIVELARSGEIAAFEELVRRRQASVRALLRRLCRDAAHADDLAQEVFLQAWRRIADLRSTAAFWSWLRQIAARTWLAQLEKQQTTARIEVVPEEVVEVRTSDRIDLDTALARLDPAVRLCIVLSYQAGMSHGEIADVTAMPLGTVKSHITRGTKVLRELLEAYEQVA